MPQKEDQYRQPSHADNSARILQDIMTYLDRIEEKQRILEENQKRIEENQMKNLLLNEPPTEKKEIQLENSIEKDESGKFQFIWTIRDIHKHEHDALRYNEKLSYYLLSESFESLEPDAPYHLKLIFYPNGANKAVGKFYSFGYCLIYGPNNDNLFWPFKKSVTFGLLNQDTNSFEFKETIVVNRARDKFFQKPKPDSRNSSFIISDYIKRKSVDHVKGYFRNNELKFGIKITK